MVAWEVLLDNDDQEQQPTQPQQFKLQHQLEWLLSLFTAMADPDTMYFHQAMKAPDRQQFQNAMDTEIQEHKKNHNCEVIPHSKVPMVCIF